jgi:RNA polymerase sigma factor (sigma-70 family)
MQKTSLSPALGKQEQALAFAAFAAAQQALRTHLHECNEVAGHILTRARAAASGEAGSRNDARKFFQSEGPTEEKLQACSQAANQEELSSALHDLGGKQALYSECLELARAPQPEVDSKAAYLKKLKSLNRDYITKRSHLVEGNLRLVAAVIKKLNLQSMPWEDLMQYGAISLQKAVESFNPFKNCSFSTYAVPVVRGDLIRAMENFSHQMRLPNHVWVKARQYNRVMEELSLILERTPSYVEMALEMGIPLEEALQLEQYQCWNPVSLDAPQGDQEDGMSLLDTLVDQNTQLPWGGSSEYQELTTPYAEELDFVERGAA